jgi:hypothetical protein
MVLVAVVLLAPTTWAKVWTTVYRCDEATPLAVLDPNHPTVYRDIMVGTRLVFVISSDTGGSWEGALLFSWDDAEYGTLSGRGYTAPAPDAPVKTPYYADSSLDAAGTGAGAWDWKDARSTGLHFRTGHTPYLTGGHPASAGDWFIFDYRAEQVGTCVVGLYNLAVTYDVAIETFSFTHVLSRDFNSDTIIDFRDLALLASHWGSPAKSDPNDPDSAFDLDGDAKVDLGDLSLFSEYWLARTDCAKPGAEPKSPSPDL